MNIGPLPVEPGDDALPRRVRMYCWRWWYGRCKFSTFASQGLNSNGLIE